MCKIGKSMETESRLGIAVAIGTGSYCCLVQDVIRGEKCFRIYGNGNAALYTVKG